MATNTAKPVEASRAGAREVPGVLRQRIRDSYSALIALRGGQKRRGQQMIIGAVATAVANAKLQGEKSGRVERLLAVQAPTGTGKSLGYSIGAIPVALSMGLKVVIATGTVALQEQLVNEDMPRLAKVIEGIEVMLVKGRQRYVCSVRAEEAAQKGDEKARKLTLALASGEWNGDVDALSDPIEQGEWAKFTNDRNGCSGRKCSKYAECAYYKAREAGKRATVLVTNHALLLADLKSGNTVLPKPEDCVYLIDEAHELPHKALAMMGEAHALRDCEEWADSVEKLISKLRRTPGGKSLDKLAMSVAEKVDNARGWAGEARMSIENSGATTIRDPKRPLRFSHGRLPAWLSSVVKGSEDAAAQAYEALELLREGIDSDVGEGMADEARERVLSEVGRAMAQIGSVRGVWKLMGSDAMDDAPPAKWIEVVGEDDRRDVRVCASPVGVGEQLHEMLWSKCAAAVHLSATIYTVGGFNPFLKESGLSREGEVRCIEVESPFDYAHQARLIVPKGIRSPKDAAGHTDDLCEALPKWLGTRKGGEGALVLFSSWGQMRAVADRMPKEVRKRILVQGEKSKRDLIAAHKDAVGRGENSVLFGSASFETGIDLPGKLLTLVVIAKLQFSVPSNPVEEARAEWLESIGQSYFDEVALPQACKRLAQSSGRLLRTESDQGEIIVADWRLKGTPYGRQMLGALPPFRFSSAL
jgi:ATP-dependent DNA helicase DinG